jgi:hypothetical protein
LLSLQRENPDATALRVNDDQSACVEIIGVLLEGKNDLKTYLIRQDASPAQLQHTWPTSLAQGEDGGEIEVVGKDDVIVIGRPAHDFLIRCVRITDVGPMNRLVSVGRQQIDPPRR